VSERLGQLAATHVQREHAAGVTLHEQIGEASGRRAHVEAHQPDGFDPEGIESRSQLETAARHERRRRLHFQFDRSRHEIARFAVGTRGGSLADPYVTPEDESLGAGSGLCQTALYEQLVEALTNGTRSGWAHASILSHPDHLVLSGHAGRDR
jgi:hypothetical protein